MKEEISLCLELKRSRGYKIQLYVYIVLKTYTCTTWKFLIGLQMNHLKMSEIKFFVKPKFSLGASITPLSFNYMIFLHYVPWVFFTKDVETVFFMLTRRILRGLFCLILIVQYMALFISPQ